CWHRIIPDVRLRLGLWTIGGSAGAALLAHVAWIGATLVFHNVDSNHDSWSTLSIVSSWTHLASTVISILGAATCAPEGERPRRAWCAALGAAAGGSLRSPALWVAGLLNLSSAWVLWLYRVTGIMLPTSAAMFAVAARLSSATPQLRVWFEISVAA